MGCLAEAARILSSCEDMVVCILLTGPQKLLQEVEGDDGEADYGEQARRRQRQNYLGIVDWGGEIPGGKGRHFKAGW